MLKAASTMRKGVFERPDFDLRLLPMRLVATVF